MKKALLFAVVVTTMFSLMACTAGGDDPLLDTDSASTQQKFEIADHKAEIAQQIYAVLSKAEKVRYKISNYELEIVNEEGNRIDCLFGADWEWIREVEDDPFIQGLRQVAETLSNEQEKTYAEEIINDWIREMQSWQEEEQRIETPIVIVMEDSETWTLYYPFVENGEEALILFDEYAETEWKEDSEARRQSGVDTMNEAISMMNGSGVSDLLNIICSSPAESSIPNDNIKIHKSEYDTLVSYGDSTLKYCVAEFMEGKQTDLRGHIMALVCEELLQSKGKLPLDASNASNGQEWFDTLLAQGSNMVEPYLSPDDYAIVFGKQVDVNGSKESTNSSVKKFPEKRPENCTLEYVIELQNKVSEAMTNGELPFVTSSAVNENPYRLHVVVNSDVESDIQKLKAFDKLGALDIEYAHGNANALE